MKFKFDSNKLGEQKAKGEYGTIHEYKDGGPDKTHHLVKRIKAKDIDSLMRIIEEFALGFNNNHSFVLNYKGIDIQEVNQDGCKYIVYILMKAQKQNLKELIREMQNKDGKKEYLPIDRVISIFYSLASALAYLEEKNIVHSNITHDSVLFDKNDTVKLAGFALSKYKTWKIPQKRMYQSYKPPERIVSLKRKTNKEEKKVAYKSDVWCLGKLIVDICLLREELIFENNVEKARQKIQMDLLGVEKNYNDPILIQILRSLLKSNRKERPTFKEICKILQKAYSDWIELLEMKNAKKEESNLDNSLSSIHFEEDEYQLDTTFQENFWRKIEEKKEEFKEVVRYTQQDIQNIITDYKTLSDQSFEELRSKVKAVRKYKIDEPRISKENIDGFLREAKEYLSDLKEYFNNKLKPKYQELRHASTKLILPSEKVISKQMDPLSIFYPANVSSLQMNQENASVILGQNERVIIPPNEVNGKNDFSVNAVDTKEKDVSEKEGEMLKE